MVRIFQHHLQNSLKKIMTQNATSHKFLGPMPHVAGFQFSENVGTVWIKWWDEKVQVKWVGQGCLMRMLEGGCQNCRVSWPLWLLMMIVLWSIWNISASWNFSVPRSLKCLASSVLIRHIYWACTTVETENCASSTYYFLWSVSN